MAELKDFNHQIIDWNLTPEHAVTMYLEWGQQRLAVGDSAGALQNRRFHLHFVVDTWGRSR